MNKFIGVFLLALCASASRASTYETLLVAANEGRTEVVTDLLQRGMDVNTVDRDGTPLLGIAARAGNEALVAFLLKNRASLHRRNRYGDTAVLMAASQGHQAVVERLLDAGADLNPEGWTPLHYAAYGGHGVLIAVLAKRGAKLDTYAPNRRTALMMAAHNGSLATVEQLLALGADRGLTDADGRTAKAIAQEKGFVEMARHL